MKKREKIVDTETGVNYLFWQEGYAGIMSIYERSFKVNFNDVDKNNKMKLQSIIVYMQEIARITCR